MPASLSLALQGIGFKSVLNRTERVGNTTRLVSAGRPYTFADDKGMVVVYDEGGKPWVGRNFQLTAEVASEIFGAPYREYWTYYGIPMKRGAYVPFSNDGGAWACENLPRAPL